MRRLKAFLVTGMGTGYLPIAPGTWGSLAVAGIYLLVAGFAGSCPYAMPTVLAGIAVISSALCVGLGKFAEGHFGKKDPGKVAIDEWAGQAVALLAMPAASTWTARLIVAGVAFLAFRIFDIAKPPPANRLQAIRGGWGILVDDLIAGVYANAAAQLILRLAVNMG